LNSKSAEWSRQVEYAQSLVAMLIGESLVSVPELMEAAFRSQNWDQNGRKLLLCQFMCPFLDELYNSKPHLLSSYLSRIKVEEVNGLCVFFFLTGKNFFQELENVEVDGASLSLARVTVWSEVPVAALFATLDELVAVSRRFVEHQFLSLHISGAALAAALEGQSFASLGVGVLFGLMEFALLLQRGLGAASRLCACDFLLGVLRHLRLFSRSQVLEALYLFSMQQCAVDFGALVWSQLIRSGVCSYNRFARFATVSEIGSSFSSVTSLALRISCPPDARAERTGGDALFDSGLDLKSRIELYVEGKSVNIDCVFVGVAEFDLDALWGDVKAMVEMDIGRGWENVVSVRSLTAVVKRLHAWIDILLLYPSGNVILDTLQYMFEQSSSEVAKALLVCLLARLWPFEGVAQSGKDWFVAKVSANGACDLLVIHDWSDDDNCVEVARRGYAVHSHALCALTLGMRPSYLPSLLRAISQSEDRFDCLMFLGPQESWSGKTFDDPHFSLWKARKMGPFLRAPPLPDVNEVLKCPEQHTLWDISRIGVTGDVARTKCVELSERIAKDKIQSVHVWMALLCCMKQLSSSMVLPKLCSLVLPAALSLSSKSVLLRPEHALVVAMVCHAFPLATFETCMQNVANPDECCLVLLERLLPLNLAAVVQGRILSGATDKRDVSPFLVEGSKARYAVLLRDPQNLVKGWTVLAKDTNQTVLSRVMDVANAEESVTKKVKL
jgi:hypothetical protein